MDFCPHCTAPTSRSDLDAGRCSVCGMSLSEAPSEPTVETTSTPREVEPVGRAASTLAPASPASTEAATIGFRGDDDDDTPHGADLIRPRELSPEYARRVTAAWRNTRNQFQNPSETIKSASVEETTFGDLKIGSRVVADVNDRGEKDYELIEVIGEGAMGSVWSARQTSLDRNVAIKVPKDVAARTEGGRQQFISEVVVTGQLDHPNIVPIYDLAKGVDGKLFYSMKRVEGRPWSELLENKELDLRENVEILLKVCDAIRFAHDRGVIHRDIKPHNIMVGQYGEVSVMDWGIAVRLDADARMSSVTRISPAGTPAYMAPEMATGNAAEIGPSTDVYLLGAVLYEALTGLPPHPPPHDSSSHLEVLTEALLIAARNEITPIEDGGELAEIAYRAMATEVENRYRSVDDFQTAIRDHLSHLESITLTERGEELLARAKANGKSAHEGRFDDFDRARFALEEALTIWPANRKAQAQLREVLLAYANYAYQEGAYARGIALLSDDNPDHKPLLRKLRAARRRTDRLWMLLRAAALLIIVGGSVFSFFLYQQWSRAENNRRLAENARVDAENNAEEARRQEEFAKANEAEARRQEELAKANEAEAKRQEGLAKASEAEAKRQEELAKANEAEAKSQEGLARDNAAEAQANALEAQQNSYAFEIGLAAEELQRNAFDRAEEILTSQTSSDAKRPLRNWEWGHLNALVNLSASSFDDGGRPLQSRVESTTVSADGAWLAAATTGGVVYVWRFDHSDQPVRLPYGAAVNAVAITPDGKTLLAAGRGEDGAHAIKAWSLPARDGAEADRVVATLDAPVLSLRLSSDAARIVAAAADGAVTIVPLEADSPPLTFRATTQENSIWDARFSPDDRWLVTAGEDGAVRVWSVAAADAPQALPREVQRFEPHDAGAVYAAAFSPDGRHVISGGRDRRVLASAFDPGSAASQPLARAEAIRDRLSSPAGQRLATDAVKVGEHNAAVRSLAFSDDGAVLFSAGDDHTVRVWDLAGGPAEASLVKTLRGHGGWVRSVVAAPGDRARVISGGYDRRVRVWDWQDYAFPLVLRQDNLRSLGDAQLTAGAGAPDGRWVATANADGVITMWDLSNPLDPQPQELAEGHDWQATTGAYFPDSRRLLTAGGDNTALVWDERNGNELVRIGAWRSDVGAGWRGVAAVSHDGRLVATGAQGDVLARVWDAQSGGLVASISATGAESLAADEAPEATALAFLADGRLVIGDQSGVGYLASPADQQDARQWPARAFPAHTAKVSAIEPLPDGHGFLTAGSDDVVRRWSADNGPPREVAVYRHGDRVVAMDLSPDGAVLVTAAGSNDDQAVLRVWDVSNPDAPLRSLPLAAIRRRPAAEGRDEMVRSVALHPTEPNALVTVFDPQSSTYRIARWDWSDALSPFRLISTGGLRDVSTAIYPPHRADAILTVGGRGARLQEVSAVIGEAQMTYRPQSAIGSLSFSSDSGRLLSASNDGSIKVWRLDGDNRWAPEAKLVGRHKGAVRSVAFHPTDNNTFLSASADGSAIVWRRDNDAWTDARTLQAPAANGAAADADRLADACFVAAGGEPAIAAVGAAGVLLWSAGQAEPVRLADGAACCVAASPDGRWLVVGAGSSARVYDVARREQVGADLTGHAADLTSLAFTADGSRLFTTSRDFTVKLWDADELGAAADSTHRELLTLEGHTDEVTSVSLVPSGGKTFVLSTGLDGQAILWPHEPPQE